MWDTRVPTSQWGVQGNGTIGTSISHWFLSPTTEVLSCRAPVLPLRWPSPQ